MCKCVSGGMSIRQSVTIILSFLGVQDLIDTVNHGFGDAGVFQQPGKINATHKKKTR